MFNAYGGEQLPLDRMDTSKVRNMAGMMAGSNITSLDFDTAFWDVSNVVNFHWMFAYTPLQSLDLSSWNPASAQDMSSMFQNMPNLTTITIPWRLTNVTDISCMFANCVSLEQVDMSNANFTTINDMQGMFADCCELTDINADFSTTRNCQHFDRMFTGCIKYAAVQSPNITSALSLADMYAECEALTVFALIADNGTTANAIEDMSDMFMFCPELTTLDISALQVDADTEVEYAFYYCDKLQTIYANDTWTAIANAPDGPKWLFYASTSLPGYTDAEEYTDYQRAKYVDEGGYFRRAGETVGENNGEQGTEEPDSNSGEPDNNTEEPDNNSEEPDNSSEEPDNSSGEPDGNSEEPDNSSEEPDNSSGEPDSNTEEPDSNSEEPDNNDAGSGGNDNGAGTNSEASHD